MRYSPVYSAQIMEPDAGGDWVKYADYSVLALNATAAANDAAKVSKAQDATIRDLHAQMAAKEDLISKQDRSLKAAKHRLRLLGHGQDCASRSTIEREGGQQVFSACNCGLDAWIKESGVG